MHLESVENNHVSFGKDSVREIVCSSPKRVFQVNELMEASDNNFECEKSLNR